MGNVLLIGTRTIGGKSMIILMDYENVSNKGFTGIEKLCEKDRLIIFYSKTSSTLLFDTHRKIESTNLLKEYISVETGGKNALDFQLSSYLGYLISNTSNKEFYIISNDEGYKYVQDFWKTRGIKVTRCPNLILETKESLKKDLKPVLSEHTSEIDKIANIVIQHKTLQEINMTLVSDYGADKANLIYKLILPIIKCRMMP